MTPVTPGHPASPDCSGIPCADGSASHGAAGTESYSHGAAGIESCSHGAAGIESCSHGAAGIEACLPRRTCAGGMMLAAVAALWLLSGCGNGLDFTGGSIPPGGTRLFGRVAEAENPLQPLARALVQVETRPVTGGVRTLQTTTAVDGSFRFINVPTGSTFTTMTVTVTPDPLQARQAQQVVFQADNGRTDNLVVSLPLSSVDVEQARSLKLRDIATLPPGDSTVIHARLFDANGRRLSVQPTLLFAGNFGSIAIDETFAATEPGTGTITAFWYKLPIVATQIVVDPNAPQLPPAPPDLPPALDTIPVPGNPPKN